MQIIKNGMRSLSKIFAVTSLHIFINFHFGRCVHKVVDLVMENAKYVWMEGASKSRRLLTMDIQIHMDEVSIAFFNIQCREN